jgi:hypothetical protein
MEQSGQIRVIHWSSFRLERFIMLDFPGVEEGSRRILLSSLPA